MATTVLLGPQRFMTTAGSTLRALEVQGPVATITAGWEEREDQDDELNQVLDGRGRNLRLYHRMFDVLDKDDGFAAAALAFRDRHDELQSFYRLRLDIAMQGVYAVQRRTSAHGTGAVALADAVEAVRRLDEWYSARLKDLYRELDAQTSAAESEVISWHRGELAGMLADSAALVITGGHVGTLLRALRLFALPIGEDLPVIAWSAGAMALTDKVVLFHDHAPQGSHEAEVYDRGLGRVPAVIALPHARRRLRLDDRSRCAVLARRFPHHRLVLLDDGTSVVFDGGGPRPGAEGGHAAYGALPHGVRVLTSDGVVQEVLAP
ncbi:Type 1 glutamine amidotransferase-like domain-containing protein [Knoellia sp. p5-6-4]|uniref:Type 1 glutamine amidotransferase-like domain-containing protein n=1 Tax=unclassified Knoellia TaxID=2618719 RepID=UPI0023DAE6D0|nr:Type 1 glutamine amidotransferase-like domain-containing protein [Knoellia sp. p5-6-4]MDF2144528.1 Type 1 glutamine amidotransferase-like domain-containing protein [Knoellia sp. p5-6-4]